MISRTIYTLGINFENVRFRWDKFVDPIPGWEVSQFWLTEDGMAKKGVFNYTFYSGEGRNLKGCEPHTAMRRAMLSMVSGDQIQILLILSIVPLCIVATIVVHCLLA